MNRLLRWFPENFDPQQNNLPLAWKSTIRMLADKPEKCDWNNYELGYFEVFLVSFFIETSEDGIHKEAGKWEVFIEPDLENGECILAFGNHGLHFSSQLTMEIGHQIIKESEIVRRKCARSSSQERKERILKEWLFRLIAFSFGKAVK